MIRGENSKNLKLYPGTTSPNFRTTEDKDMVSLAKLFGMMNWVKKWVDVRSLTNKWVTHDEFLVENFF